MNADLELAAKIKSLKPGTSFIVWDKRTRFRVLNVARSLKNLEKLPFSVTTYPTPDGKGFVVAAVP